MICEPCCFASHYNQVGKTDMSKEMHDNCEGDCGCQHKIGQGWVVKRGQKPPTMQTQSP